MLVRRVWNTRPSFALPFGGAFFDFDTLHREIARRDVSRLADAFPDSDPGHGVFPPLNVTQDADAYYVRAELPGVDAKALSISAHHNRLEISGSRQIPREQERVSYHRKERAEGSFSRAITLPSEIDTARVDARYADGILTLTVPKAEQAKPREIKVPLNPANHQETIMTLDPRTDLSPPGLDATEQTRPGPVVSPAVDIFESDDRITLLADLPGVRTQDLSIDVRDSVLTLSGKITDAQGGSESAVLREYSGGTFFRRFNLAETIDQTKIDAKLTDGVLRLELPKVERAKPRQIAVRSN